MSRARSIHFILTGGTIDSYYEGTKDTVVPNKKSVVPEYIRSLKIQGKVVFSEVCMKDSRDLSKNDLRRMLKAIEGSRSKSIVVTHGTYTMPESARFVAANLERKDQTVVFTGSMIPLTGFSPSDAGFNLGFAMSQSLHMEPGVYVAMNGEIFSEEVVKLLKEGRFSSVFGEH